jgi:ribosomal protein S2
MKKNKNLLNLKLIQTKITKNSSIDAYKNNKILPRLKKVLQIIYQYTIKNKRILFIGAPLNLEIKFDNILKKTKHIFIPEYIWVNGLITNRNIDTKTVNSNLSESNKKIFNVLFRIKKRLDLIILLEKNLNNAMTNESYQLKIPLITFDNQLDINDIKSSYKIPGNFKFANKKLNNNFIYSLILAIIKKANYVEKIKIHKFYKPSYLTIKSKKC